MKKSMVVSKIGEVIPLDWKRIGQNFLMFTLPLFLSTFFAQLALGVKIDQALSISLISLYGPIADYIKKRQAQTSYDTK